MKKKPAAVAAAEDWFLSPVSTLNNSKVFAGLMIVVLNISSKYVNMRLPKAMESYLKHTFSRNILVFAICWMGTRDILISLILTCLFVLLFDYLLNEESPICCLPESFTNYHIEKLKKEEAAAAESKKPAAAAAGPPPTT